ncbi:hypothetical protein ERJ75_000359500 [Trypanosoma vivax]|nr:hypothetical protein ERJ75_000359500 [Trypanosoma vivax]
MNLEVIDATLESLPLELLNATNKELTAQLSRYEQIHEQHVREVEDQRRRLEFVREHLSNVRGEIVNTQSLADTKRREVESETHMLRLLVRECGRLAQSQVQMEAQDAVVKERLQDVQNRLFTENLRMAELKSAMAFNQEALEKWDEARQQKEADEAVVARYAKTDALKVRQLDAAVERGEAKLRERQRQLKEEVATTHNVQLELDRAASDYRRLHGERSKLIKDWENVVNEIHVRDKAIRSAAQQYSDGADWIERRREVLKRILEDLDAAREDEASVQAGIAEREQNAEKSRETKAALETHVAALEDEVEGLREGLSCAVRDRNNSRIQLERSKTSVEDKKVALAKLEKKKDALKEQQRNVCSEATDLVSQRDVVSRLLSEARMTDQHLDRGLEEMKHGKYIAGERLHEVVEQQRLLAAEISGAQSQGRNLKAKINQLDSEHFSQQQLLYGIEFNVQQMQRKVNRARGERTEEEREHLTSKIDALQSTLDELGKQQCALEVQVKRVRDETQHANAELVKLRGHEKIAGEKLLQLQLGCGSCSVELGELRKVREEKIVWVDTQELQLQGLKRILHQRNDEINNLNEQKRQFSIGVSERMAEIALRHDVLRMEAKLMEERRRQLVSELQERHRSLTGLRNRYDVQSARLCPGSMNMTQAQLVMEAARERENLQVKGDALDQRVARMEKEVAKLMRTLCIIRASNSNYRHLFDRVSDEHEMARTRMALQQQQRELKAAISRRTLELSDYQQVLQGKMLDLKQTVERREKAVSTLEELRAACEQAHSTLMQDRETVVRYDQAIRKARASVSVAVVADVDLVEEQERFSTTVSRVLQIIEERKIDVGDHIQSVLTGFVMRPIDA